MLVKATKKYQELKVKDKELDRIPKEGEKFEITKERYDVLTKTNQFKEVFVEEVPEIKKIETAVIKQKQETATKKTRKKKQNDVQR